MSWFYAFLRHDLFDEDGFPKPHIHGPGDAASTVPRPAGGGAATTTASPPAPAPAAASDPWTYEGDIRWRDVAGRRLVQQYDPNAEVWVTISTTAAPETGGGAVKP